MSRALLFAVLASAFFASQAAVSPPSIVAKSWLLVDLSSNQVLGAEKPDERMEPASLTKVMTAYLVFTAVREKKLALEQQVRVSERASRAPGARMFIQPGKPVTADQLVRGMIVQSGNDACIALAEAVAGTEEAFVEMMNREAARLGMSNTHFMNASGLPDARHYSTARDLYLVSAALIRDFPDLYAQYYALKEFRYGTIAQPNRNRLLWLDPTVDGMKSGHTEAAGYCLIASSRRNGRRLLSVLLGSTSETGRARESLKLLNWGYQSFDSVRLYSANEVAKMLDVWKGSEKKVKAGFRSDLMIAVPRGEGAKLKAQLLSQQPLLAPVGAGQRVGTLRISLEGKPVGEYPLVALEPVAVAGILGRTWDTLRLWLK